MAPLASPPCPFGPWERLRLADVRSFLRSDPAERTIWEAKRHATKGELSTFVRKECCAFANRRGGYLLLGAEYRKGSGWALRGVDVPKVKELHDWIASLLRDLKPRPGFDVHEWGLSNGRRVVVIQVEPAPIPPVSFDGRVYIRHGSQTLVADGPAISRLSNDGARAIRVVERATRKRAKEEGLQLFAPMAIAIGRPGQRDRPLSDPEPERIAYARMREALQKRWRKRQLRPLIIGADREVQSDPLDVSEFVLVPAPDPAYAGWRAAWEVEDIAQTRRSREWLNRPRKSRRRGFGSGPSPGVRDVWTTHIEPDAITVCSHIEIPGMRDMLYEAYGAASIVDAEMLLRAMIAMELDLGGDPTEQVFTCLALRNPWTPKRDLVFIEHWTSLSVNPREWRKLVTDMAGQRMQLEPPVRLPIHKRRS